MRAWPALAATALVLLAGCGGERTFDAQGFVDEANSNGAELELGDELLNEQEGVQVREVRLGDNGSGSLTVAADADGAFSDYQRCEAAVSLLCYRAANVVLILEDELSPADREQLEAAITDLGSD